MRLTIDDSKISEKDKNPTVLLLLEIVREQADTIQKLKDEIARLKKHPPRPKIKPSQLENNDSGKKKPKDKKRPGSKKRKKTAQLEIHETIPIPLDNIPQGASFKGYKSFVVQGIKIKLHNTKYLYVNSWSPKTIHYPSSNVMRPAFQRATQSCLFNRNSWLPPAPVSSS